MCLQISQGNLNYHFPKKENIITVLYDRFSQKVEQLVQERLQNEDLDLDQLESFLYAIMGVFLKYRFIFLDFARLMQDHPDIKVHYVHLVEQRINQFSVHLQVLAEKGINVEVVDVNGEAPARRRGTRTLLHTPTLPNGTPKRESWLQIR